MQHVALGRWHQSISGSREQWKQSTSLRTTGQNPSGGRCGKRPIESNRETAGRSDPSGGRRGRTGRFSGDRVPPLDEFGRYPVGAGLATGPASESRRPGHASGWGDCRRRHRFEPWASGGHQVLPGVGPEPAAARPTRRAAPGCGHRRWHGLRSRRLPRAWPDRRPRAARQSLWLGPPGKARFVRPFFGRFLGAVEQDLIPVDPVQQWVPFGPLPPAGWNTSSASQTVNRRWIDLWDGNPTGSNSQGIPTTHT